MSRARGDMSSPIHLVPLLLSFATLCRAGPLGPFPNATRADLGLKEGSCALGDVVYMPGDEFPGSSPCERCVCVAGSVTCEKQTCEPRPGCKALHRPDHCCPTYQCECEQEGRVYGNGEKLVDPADPCRVCYCQGGEVVCRRIACFVRDDCTPRLVPGRCCPEYDNCPLRGVTSLPASSSISSLSTIGIVATPAVPPKENIKPEITIKEITPVSEIPVITEVKIKEILPVPTDVAEYSSSKSPLITREATSEKTLKESDSKTESPSVIEVHSSLPIIVSSPEATQFTSNKESDAPPSKISFSTQDSINSAIYPSNVPIVAIMGVPPVTAEAVPAATSKAHTIMEEEDTFDHNPAFPPIPDDLSVLRNHEDEIVPEPVVDGDHVPSADVVASAIPLSISTEPEVKQPETTQTELPSTTTTTTTPKYLPDTTVVTTTNNAKTTDVTTDLPKITLTTEALTFKESPMLNLRSAIPTEILNSPSLIPEELGSGHEETTTIAEKLTSVSMLTDQSSKKMEEINTEIPTYEFTSNKIDTTTTDKKIEDVVTESATKKFETSTEFRNTPEIILVPEMSTVKFTNSEVTSKEQEQTTTSVVKSNAATEVTSQTELSSLPIETSDQNPPQIPEHTTNDKTDYPTTDITVTSTRMPVASSEIITVSRGVPNESTNYDNVETTEFILTSFESEMATDAVELIKISAEPEKSAAIIETPVETTEDEIIRSRDVVSTAIPEVKHFEIELTEATKTFNEPSTTTMPKNLLDTTIVPSTTTIKTASDTSTTTTEGYKNSEELTTQKQYEKIPTYRKSDDFTTERKIEGINEGSTTTEFNTAFTTAGTSISHQHTSFGSAETATDSVEIIKMSSEPEKSAAIIEPAKTNKNNVLTDLIKLVSDVASIGNHTDEQESDLQVATTTNSVSGSEELIPVNSGYKSKNKNFNQNSITEVPFKGKITNPSNKQKIVEIEDDESEGVTDAAPPNDRVEPTTRRPLIDNVTDDMAAEKSDKKDIEIIRQSYVPTISRRPTKVVMKKSEKPASDESVTISASAEIATDSSVIEDNVQTTVTTVATTSVTDEAPRTET